VKGIDNPYLNEGFTAEETELLGCEADRITDGVCYKNGERYDCSLKDKCPVDFSTERGRRNYDHMLIRRLLKGEVLTDKQRDIIINHLFEGSKRKDAEVERLVKDSINFEAIF